MHRPKSRPRSRLKSHRQRTPSNKLLRSRSSSVWEESTPSSRLPRVQPLSRQASPRWSTSGGLAGRKVRDGHNAVSVGRANVLCRLPRPTRKRRPTSGQKHRTKAASRMKVDAKVRAGSNATSKASARNVRTDNARRAATARARIGHVTPHRTRIARVPSARGTSRSTRIRPSPRCSSSRPSSKRIKRRRAEI